MGDEAVPVRPAAGADVAPTDSPTTTPDVPALSPARAARAAKVASAREGLSKLATTGGVEQPRVTPPAPPAKPAAPAVAPAAPAKKADESKPPAPAAPGGDDDETPSDPQVAKAIAAIERRDQRAREQLAKDQAAWKQQRDLELAELQRAKAELAKAPALDDLKKLPTVQRAIAAMKAVGLDPDDEEVAEVIARDTYARSKSGKADPKNRAYADQLAEKSGLTAELAELRRMVEETRETITQRDQRAQAEAFQNQYLDEAVKAVPSDPSFIGQALAANPKKARAALLSIGQRLERDTGELPTHAEVIAEYERETRAELADRGLTAEQINALLGKPKAPAAPAPAKPSLTLDPSAGSTTKPVSPVLTREQKVAAAREGRQKLA